MNMNKDFLAFRQKMASAQSLRLETRDAPDVAKLAETIEKLNQAFVELKSTHEQELKELKKGGISPETAEKLAKINAEMSQLEDFKTRLEKIETRAARPGANGGQGAGRSDETPAMVEHRDAFCAWMRDPKDRELESRSMQAWKARLAEMTPDQRKAVDTTSGSTGGFAVPELIDREVSRLGKDVAGIASLVRVVNVGTPDYKRLFDVGGHASGWVGETDARAGTANSSLAEVGPTFGTVYAYPKATEESLMDVFFDVEQWLTESAVEGFDFEEEQAIIAGNGTKKPTGFLAGPAPVATTDKAGRAFGTLQFLASGNASTMPDDCDKLIDMVQSLRAKYRRNANWVANSLTVGALRKYKTSTGEYLWEPSTQAGMPSKFLGYGVVECESMPDIAANSLPLAFGDIREGYVLARIQGLRITRDDVTEPGYVKWYIRRRVGGKIGNSQAIKLLKIAA